MKFIVTQLLAGVYKNDQQARKCSAQPYNIDQEPCPILFYPSEDLHVYDII